MLRKDVSFCHSMALIGGFRVPLKCSLEILLTIAAVLASETQFELCEGVASFSRFLDDLGTVERGHGGNCSNQPISRHGWRNVPISLFDPDRECKRLFTTVVRVRCSRSVR